MRVTWSLPCNNIINLALIQFLFSELAFSVTLLNQCPFWTKHGTGTKPSGFSKRNFAFYYNFPLNTVSFVLLIFDQTSFKKTPESQSPHVNPWPTVTAAQRCDGEGRLNSILLKKLFPQEMIWFTFLKKLVHLPTGYKGYTELKLSTQVLPSYCTFRVGSSPSQKCSCSPNGWMSLWS